MAKEINIVDYPNKKFGIVRATIIDDEAYFVAKDVAKALGYKDTDQAIRKHVDEDDKLDFSTRHFDGSKNKGKGSVQTIKLINESGLYSLILSSKLPDAKRFKKWVTKEVLPSLRASGFYETEEWKRIRKLGKENRINITSAIRMFVDYCDYMFIDPNDLISDYFDNPYSAISCLINSVINLPYVNDRDKLPDKILSLLDICETIVCRIIINDVVDHKKPKKILKHIKNKLLKLREEAIEAGILEDTIFVDMWAKTNHDDNDD